ncbi:MAG: tetratricopeptide repeat protein [Pseudomonadota bacterium]|nr:tetratricopeptide repeat protein [Pseudomonadota bacterium]
MDELLNEHEQGERVRSWLQRNALGLIGGIVAGLALIWAWQWWQGQRAHQGASQAIAYDDFEQKLAGPLADAEKAYALVPANTTYAVLAGLDLAKLQVDNGKNDEALATLRGLKTKDNGLQLVINQRIAQLLLQAGKPADALALIGKADDAVSLELIGDAEAAQQKTAAARDAYQKALRTLEEGSPGRQLVELKLSEVGGDAEPAKPAADAAG